MGCLHRQGCTCKSTCGTIAANHHKQQHRKTHSSTQVDPKDTALMVSCSGFGLPMHAQLLRLFVTHTITKDTAKQKQSQQHNVCAHKNKPEHEPRNNKKLASTRQTPL